MTQPGSLNNLVPRHEDEMVKRLEALEASVQRLSASVGLRSPDFNGSGFANPGTAGNYFGADGAVLNNLYLRNGIVGDAALANPAAFGMTNADWDTLTFTVANLEKTTAMVVPAGYSRALVMATATAGATASATATANVYASCSIQGVHPEFVEETLAASYGGSVSRSYAASLTRLTGGGTVTIGALGVIDVNGSVLANNCNLHVTGAAIFLR